MPANASSSSSAAPARNEESSFFRRPIQYFTALARPLHARRRSVSPSPRPRGRPSSRADDREQSARSAPGSRARSGPAPRHKLKHKSSAQTPLTTEQKVALLQLLDGGSTKKVRRRLAKATARAEEKSLRSDSVGPHVGVGVEVGLHAEDGTYWRDQAERDEFTALVTGDYVHGKRKKRRSRSQASPATRAASDDDSLVVVDAPQPRPRPTPVASSRRSNPPTGEEDHVRRGRPTRRRPRTSHAETVTDASSVQAAQAGLARDAFFADSFDPRQRLSAVGRPFTRTSSAPATPTSLSFDEDATSHASHPSTPRSRRAVQSLYVVPTSPLASQLSDLRIRARTPSLGSPRGPSTSAVIPSDTTASQGEAAVGPSVSSASDRIPPLRAKSSFHKGLVSSVSAFTKKLTSRESIGK